MGTYDKVRITVLIEDIRKYFSDLEKTPVRNLADLQDTSNYYALSMILFQLINRAIDLGDELVSAENLGMPGTYKNIFQRLLKAKIISAGLYEELYKLVRIRNLIAHEYETLTEKDIYAAFHKVRAINQLIEIVKARSNGKRGS